MKPRIRLWREWRLVWPRGAFKTHDQQVPGPLAFDSRAKAREHAKGAGLNGIRIVPVLVWPCSRMRRKPR